MKSWTIKIPIRPMGSPRPRFARRGKFVQTYMPKNYEDYKRQLTTYFPKLNLEGPLKIDVVFFFEVTKSWTKKKKEQLIWKHHTQKPDRDNLDKSVLDAMQGIVFADDTQVAEGRIAKFWADRDLIVIKITELEE